MQKFFLKLLKLLECVSVGRKSRESLRARARARAKAAVSSFLFALSERAGFPVGRANFVI